VQTCESHRPDGSPLGIDLMHSAPLILLVFNPDCAICEENWVHWDKLISDPRIGRQCLLLSTSPKLPSSYINKHPATQRSALLGLSAEIARSFNLASTPQTILVEHGKIVRTWPSVLSEDDVQEVKKNTITLSGGG